MYSIFLVFIDTYVYKYGIAGRTEIYILHALQFYALLISGF